MKTLIICESVHHGNTKKVAERMGKALGAKLLKASEIHNPDIIRKFDIVGFGSGIYNGGYHRNLLALAERLPKMKGKHAFLFSSSGSALGLFNARKKELDKKLEERGLTIIAEFSCRGWDSWGLLALIGGMNKDHPDELDLRNAELFAIDLKKKIRRLMQ